MRNEMWRWTARGAGFGVGVISVGTIGWALLRATNVLVLVVLAILLASGLEPGVGWIRTRTKLGRGRTILVVYAGFFALFVALAALIVPSAVTQFTELGNRLPKLLANMEDYGKSVGPPFGEAIVSVVHAVRSALNGTSDTPQPGVLVAAGATAADAIISVISVLTLIFFWLTGHQRIQRFVLALIPADSRAGVREGWNEVEARLGLWVRGQLLIMGTIFALTGTAYFLLGLEGALLLGLIAGIAEAIPIVGPALGAVPALVVAAATGRVELVLLVAGVYVVIQLVEGNVLVPMVMRSTIGVPPFVVIVSLLSGAALGGVVGAFLAVPFAAALVVILERVQDRDQAIPLDGGSTSSTPSTEERDAMELRTADGRSPS